MNWKAIVSALTLLGIASTPEGTIATKIAFIKNDNLFVRENGITRQLTNDALAKSLPLWSKDGSMLAFDRHPDLDKSALANLVVLRGDDGAQIANIEVLPANERNPASMRFVEGLEWRDSNRIVASGSIDPSTTEYVTYTIPEGKVVDLYYDQGMGASFSPDGAHIAYVSGSPHFVPVENRDPNLQIDGKRIYPRPGGPHVVFLSQPAWAPDGNTVAIVEEAYGAQRRSAVECSLSADCVTVALPDQMNTESFTLHWDSQGLFLLGAGQEWTARNVGSEFVSANSNAVSATSEIESEAKAAIRAAGGTEADAWCSNCPLITYPRRTSEK